MSFYQSNVKKNIYRQLHYRKLIFKNRKKGEGIQISGDLLNNLSTTQNFNLESNSDCATD